MPKYIVDYIVENTLGPLTEEASKQVETLRSEVEQAIKKLKKIHRGWENVGETPGVS